MAIINFGGIDEEVVKRDEFRSKSPLSIENETIAILGYGTQSPGHR